MVIEPPTVRTTTPYGDADLVLDGADRVRVQASRRRALALSVFRVEYDITAVLERVEGCWTLTRLEGRPQAAGKGWDLSGAAERELRGRLPLVVDAHLRALPSEMLRAAEIARLQAQRETLAERITTARAALEKARSELGSSPILGLQGEQGLDFLRERAVLACDYARDAADDFGRGEIRSALAFAQRIVESPSGWWCSADGASRVSVCCHHFDNNSFRLDLDARPPSTIEDREG